MIRDSSVNLVTGYGLRDPRSIPDNDISFLCSNMSMLPRRYLHLVEGMFCPLRETARNGELETCWLEPPLSNRFRERCRGNTYTLAFQVGGLDVVDILTPYKLCCFETLATGSIWPEMDHSAVVVVVVVVVVINSSSSRCSRCSSSSN